MLIYGNSPCTVQAYTDTSTLRHEGLPKEWGKASTHPLSSSSTAMEKGTAARDTPAPQLPELGVGLGDTWQLSSYTSRLAEVKTKGFFQISRHLMQKKEGTSLQSLAAAPTARAALALLGQQAWEGHVPSHGTVLQDARVSILLGLPRSPPRAEWPWAGLGQRGTSQGTRGGSGEGDRLCAPRSKGRGGFVPHSVTDF